MVTSMGKNRLRKKYCSDFTHYFNNSELSDIIIQVTENGWDPEDMMSKSKDKYEFFAHKFVLSARSPVFMKMLSSSMIESKQTQLEIHFPKSIFYMILKYMYSGSIELDSQSVLDVLATADFYNLEDLKEFCGWFSLRSCMEGDKDMDICKVLHSAEQYGLEKIKVLCFDYITQHSMDILLSSPNWHLLTEESLISILDQDNLRVPEVEIFDSLVRWAQKQYAILKDLHGGGSGKNCINSSEPPLPTQEEFLKRKLSKPLKSIRFASMYPYQLSDHIEQTELVDKDILYEAYRYSAAGVIHPRHLTSSQLRQGVKEFQFESLNDQNGVLYYFGTLEGQDDTYDSPVTRKIIKVTSSSMSIGYPHPFAGRISTNMYTDKQDNSYYCVDLGTNYVLCPTYYSMRYGGDSQGSIYAAPKNWQFQGSLDGVEWKVLKDHQNDMSLKEGYSIAGWELKSIHSYRYLRILQTGPNQRNGNELCVCCFEVYGRLVKLQNDDGDGRCSSLKSSKELLQVGSEINSDNQNSNRID